MLSRRRRRLPIFEASLVEEEASHNKDTFDTFITFDTFDTFHTFDTFDKAVAGHSFEQDEFSSHF